MPLTGIEHGLISLGFTVACLPGRVLVKEVEADTWAAAVGLQPGDLLAAVNGLTACELSYEDLSIVTRQRPLKMLIESSSGEPSLQCDVNTVNGFQTSGASEGPLTSRRAYHPHDITSFVPFQLRSVETGKRHPLRLLTRVGRSSKQVNPDADLVVSGLSMDVSRIHCYIHTSLIEAPDVWEVRVFDAKGGGGHGKGPGGGFGDGGGTVVDSVPVDPEYGTVVEPGAVLRFGVNELWVLEQASLFSKGEFTGSPKRLNGTAHVQETYQSREIIISSANALHTFERCTSWIDIVQVILDLLDLLEEPPCADRIEVVDERGPVISSFAAKTLDAMLNFNVAPLLEEVKFGRSVRVRLFSEPSVLEPLLAHLEREKAALQLELERRPDVLNL
mmetsp:Transcript_46030/g.109574  ORF Transcript_46030/g.109574 Transcript_46030/m.109574 type:complete len:389 (+) Transcript_46030:70-1236(+)